MEKQPVGTHQSSEVLWTEEQLAAHQQVSSKKLQADRWKGVGVPYVKIGRLVRYRPADAYAYEARHCVAVKS